jgi:hypothetical protein
MSPPPGGIAMGHKLVADALRRHHLLPFVWAAYEVLAPGKGVLEGWHVSAMCDALEEVAAGRTKRLLITVPPRHGKSLCTAVGFVAWMLGHDPSMKIMVASYGSDLATKHARDFRAVVSNLPSITVEDEKIRIAAAKVVPRRKGEALCPGRQSLDDLERLRLEMGSAAFSAQYQQDPTPPGGNRVRWEWFGTYDETFTRTYFQLVVQSWDTALTAEVRATILSGPHGVFAPTGSTWSISAAGGSTFPI